MSSYETRAGLSVAPELARFVEDEVLPGLGMAAEGFWSGVAGVFGRFAPEKIGRASCRERVLTDV